MVNGYRIKRRDTFLGKELHFGESGSNSFIRLARKRSGTWKRPVHEIWDVTGEIEELKAPIDHIAAESVGDFVKRINYYTSINARHLYEKGVHTSFLDIILYPKTKFIMDYVIKQGFRDGTHGFVHAMLMSFHSFLTRSKLWLLQNKK